MTLPPIGIVTCNRFTYLACTLHSLAGSDLPPGLVPTIYDDGSTDSRMHRFLYTNSTLSLHTGGLPRGAGFECLASLPRTTRGIKSEMPVVKLRGCGSVFAASCQAMLDMVANHPKAPGVILLQDDVLFNRDWYARMTRLGQGDLDGKPIGLLAGIRLNRTLKPSPDSERVLPGAATAQCLYIRREVIETLHVWLRQKPTRRVGFDDSFFRMVAKHTPYATGLLYPFCCQHIGCHSRVRPGRSWTRFSLRGRIGYYAHPPYTMSQSIKFSPAT